jgi:hydroxymethylpyrimidine pyrophosphatase-like HAD family hydrolase
MKKCTIFCDIDGTLLEYRKFETYKSTKPNKINTTIERINNAFDNGERIILTTARPEYLRTHTLKELNEANIKYHTLIMGIERGTRILINDNSEPTIDRAYAFNLQRNKGFTQEDEELFNSLCNIK